ncbi:hypothetical protein [Spirosoma lituiforme]|jgi:hypothetical protein
MSLLGIGPGIRHGEFGNDVGINLNTAGRTRTFQEDGVKIVEFGVPLNKINADNRSPKCTVA